VRRALAIIATLLLVAGGLFMALLNVGEKLIYFPQPLTPTAGQAILARHPQALEVMLTTSDGAQLHGWHLPAGTGSARPLVLYFGGNAEEVSWMLEFGSVFAGWDLGFNELSRVWPKQRSSERAGFAGRCAGGL
jgi:hypothetical protein